MLFGKALEYGALRLTSRRKRNVITRLGAIQHPGDHAVLPLVNGARRSFAAHRAINRFDGQLAAMSRSVRFPSADFSFARLPSGEAYVYRLLHRLINRRGGETYHNPHPPRSRGAEITGGIPSVFSSTN